MTTESFLKGLLVGSLAGLAAGILYAPKSGEETRKQIVDSSEKMRKKVAGLAEHEKEVYIESKDRLKNAVHAGVETYKKSKVVLQPLNQYSPYKEA
ncbi:MAG: YtxH domain-containing protein [Smithella sp.]